MAQLRASLLSPQGFQIATASIAFHAVEQGNKRQNMNLSLVHAPHPHVHYAALTTTNAFRSPSVAFLREKRNRGYAQTLLVNNKISNAASQYGDANLRQLQEQLSALLRVDTEAIIPISTGIIGWRLPMAEINAALSPLVARLGEGSFVDFATSIMTTDRFVKARSCEYEDGRIVAACKGAGMVEPRLNTMLAFFFTDIAFTNRELHHALSCASKESFEKISVDGDQSTSDIVMIQSSGLVKRKNLQQFTRHLSRLAQELALDIVRNSEGAGHIIMVTVKGAASRRSAEKLARFLLHSRLVTTAIAGNDPNVGRVIARVGQYCGSEKEKIDFRRVRITIESNLVFEKGYFLLNPKVETSISQSLREKEWDSHINGYPIIKAPVELIVDLGAGNKSATLYGPDLTKEYVHINSDYRT